jgi:peptidoglycan/LPS O-acetylase OafA/YrhL
MAGRRLYLIDALKALAAQLIVWHHLAYYGPMSDMAQPLAPALISWLYDDGRYAVQVFLVVGGFLAARGLMKGVTASQYPGLLWKRYLRLASPLPAVLIIAIAANELAGQWMDHDSISPTPGLGQIAAHLLLAHKMLDFDSISAGLWYPAIDFQLFALLAALVVLARAHPHWSAWLVVGLTALSSLFVNRWPEADVFGHYFFGAYGLGALVVMSGGRLTWPVIVVTLTSLLALALEFRERLVLALLTASALWCASRWPRLMALGNDPLISWFADRSYSLFLIHFPVLLVINAGFSRFATDAPTLHALGMVIGYLASLGASNLFYRFIEQPLQRRLR